MTPDLQLNQLLVSVQFYSQYEITGCFDMLYHLGGGTLGMNPKRSRITDVTFGFPEKKSIAVQEPEVKLRKLPDWILPRSNKLTPN